MEIKAGCGLFRPPLPANPWCGDYTAAASISASTHRFCYQELEETLKMSPERLIISNEIQP